jgi:exopolysaccharide biosynthesis polyprenyl glycosylphosphotransferase
MTTSWEPCVATKRDAINTPSNDIASDLSLRVGGSSETYLNQYPTVSVEPNNLNPGLLSQIRTTRRRPVREALVGSRLGWASFDFVSAGLCALCATLLAEPRAATPNAMGLSAAILGAVLFGSSVALLSYWTHPRHLQENDGAAYEKLQILKSVTLSALAVRGLLTLFGNHATSRLAMESEVLFTFIAMMLARVYWRWRRLSWRRRGHSSKNFAVAGLTDEGRQIREYLTSLSYAGYKFKGFISLDDAEAAGVVNPEQVIGPIQDSIARSRSHFVDEIFLVRRPKTPTLIQLLEEARSAGIDIRVIPDVSEMLERRTDVHYIGDMPTIVLHRAGTQEVSKFFKRLLDCLGAGIGLALLSPLFAVLALAIKLDSSGPVFYSSERVGLKGRIFRCNKFRTMVQNAHELRSQIKHLNEREGVLFKIAKDPRITRLGRILRKYSLDELPQFWNVLRGDMSLVGPRPPIGDEVAQYRIDQFCRLEVLPGITGLWQVEARSNPSFESYIELDRKYVNNWSIWFDLKILWRTMSVVLGGTGT